MLDDLRQAEIVGSSEVQFDDGIENTNKERSGESYMPMFEEAQQELYPGCTKFSAFSFLVKLMHIKVLNCWTNKSFNKLLELLRAAFPEPNLIPNSHYEAKEKLKQLGLGYESIHVCVNDCILFWDEHKDKETCPVCKESRFKYEETKQKKIPHKVLRYFPLKPRLKRLFLTKHIAEEMRWHQDNRIETNGVLRHPADADSWKKFNNLHTSFAADPRNVRLGLATDGFNPFGNMSNSYSVWPVLLVPYNLPPWKMMKPSHTIMSLLIPGPKAPGKEIDVYLRPLINELKELWDDGIEVYDASTAKMFRLHAAIMWTIHDFLAYGTISGWSTKGYKACPVCLEDTISSPLRSKICYTGHRRFLCLNHSWRKNKSFNGKSELEGPPRTFTGEDILTQLNALPEVIFGKHHAVTGKRKRLVSNANWVKKSIFFELKYWKDLTLRHNLDVMHIEKNICDALVGTLLNIDGKSKDTDKARLDLHDMGIRSELHIKKIGEKNIKPHACYTLTLNERREFCHFLKSVKFPDGYAANISRNVNVTDGKLHGLKTHDCHVLMQRLLPIPIRKFFSKDVCRTIVELCDFFKKLCAKTLHIEDLKKMEEDIVLILCKLERLFPPAFFDVMIHLAVHLPREAMLAGPVSSRWMYPFERYLGTLKKYVRNRSRPEGSIAEGYIVDEALTFSSIYMTQIETMFTRPERNKDVDQPISSTLTVFSQKVRMINVKRNHKLSWSLRKKAHWYILNNCKEVEIYINEHMQNLSSRVSPNHILQCQENEFPGWFRNKMTKLRSMNHPEATDELYSLALGPDVEVHLHDACVVNGVRYRTKSLDARRATQSSGVSVPSSDDGENLDFFGVLNEIVQVFYNFGYGVQLFWCDWFQCNPKKKSVIQEFGLTCIDTSKTWYEDDPFILVSQAQQVYYMDDIKRGRHWKVVMKVQHREIFEAIEEKDENNGEPQCSSGNNEPDQEISSNDINLVVGEEIETSQLDRNGVQPQHIELAETSKQKSNDVQDFINDEDVETEVDSDEDELIIPSDEDSD